ncbi:hypothetical protein [Bradyrhizobium sp. BWA-3-5]|uniref:hypothetical protein n=1 Tax=Bradyrhizobium sp. BWA-3-5 TaxID=3080013 RepID=UPI00293E66D4|nr:hypothetical protein [Bradyrhizobium sp. BWA-3-5]WOH67018.1 hypothetical protein RX331_04365 [Bradyrhizobium sp. BWA-3-5]
MVLQADIPAPLAAFVDKIGNLLTVQLFALGAGISVYEGISHIADPSPIENITVNYLVLALSALFEGASWWLALATFRTVKGDLSYWDAIRRSKDPPSFIVLLEDSAALIGISIAALGIYLTDRLAASRRETA